MLHRLHLNSTHTGCCHGRLGLFYGFMRKVSLRDIATLAGTSVSTVSLVLNGKEKEMRISPALAKKVRLVARREGYHPNRVAVGLRTGKSNIIGLIVDSISGHFFAALAEIIEKQVEVFGYRVIYCSTGNDKKKGKDLLRMLYQHQVDGYLIIPAEGMEAEIKALAEQGKPLVLMDSYFPKIKAPYVLVDNYGGVCSGVQHLIEKGYRTVAFVYNDLNLVQMKERKRGYTQTLIQNGLPVDSGLMLETRLKSSKEEQIESVSLFLKTTKADAVFFAANYLGVYGLTCVKDLGLTIPTDVAVVCFDDNEIFRLHQPAITVVSQPIADIATTAVNILMSKMELTEKLNTDQTTIKPHLIERSSTR